MELPNVLDQKWHDELFDPAWVVKVGIVAARCDNDDPGVRKRYALIGLVDRNEAIAPAPHHQGGVIQPRKPGNQGRTNVYRVGPIHAVQRSSLTPVELGAPFASHRCGHDVVIAEDGA
jgi:hypothetical protein